MLLRTLTILKKQEANIGKAALAADTISEEEFFKDYLSTIT